jgi:hypothetical protein
MGKASTCLVCLLRVNYDIFQRFYPVQGYCQHSKTYFSSKPQYKISQKLLVHNIVMALLYVAPLISYSIYMPEVCRTDKSLCLIFIADEIYLVCGIVLSLILFAKIKFNQLELNCWSFIFDNPEVYHLGPIMSHDAIKKFRVYRAVTFLLIFSANFAMGFLYFYFPYDYLPGHVLRRLSILTIYCFHSYGALEITRRVKVLALVLRACEKSFMTVFCDKLPIRIKSKFRNYFTLINLINLNITMMMKYLAFLLVMWILTSIVSLIFNIYVLIDFYDYDLCTLSTLATRTLTTILEILVVLIIVEEKVNRKVSNLLHISNIMLDTLLKSLTLFLTINHFSCYFST